jgi:hypothetical protein
LKNFLKKSLANKKSKVSVVIKPTKAKVEEANEVSNREQRAMRRKSEI